MAASYDDCWADRDTDACEPAVVGVRWIAVKHCGRGATLQDGPRPIIGGRGDGLRDLWRGRGLALRRAPIHHEPRH